VLFQSASALARTGVLNLSEYLGEPTHSLPAPEPTQVARVLLLWSLARDQGRHDWRKSVLALGYGWYTQQAQEILAEPNAAGDRSLWASVRTLCAASALSPQLPWERIPELLRFLPTPGEAFTRLQCGNHQRPQGVLGKRWASALGCIAAMTTEDLEKAVGKGPKVRSFALNLLQGAGATDPSAPDRSVTIDTHAAALIGLDPKRLTLKLYRQAAAAYVAAARILGESPRDVQAVTWVHWRGFTRGAKEKALGVRLNDYMTTPKGWAKAGG
jgi:hypothetical protein